MTGIDISGVQPDDVAGAWEFIVVKSSEGTSITNHRVDAQWANAARTRRGLYHYARPGLSNGETQADFFADDAQRRGFTKDTDMWQLDCEGMLNDGITGPHWRQFVDQFMAVALLRLGRLGFVYCGRFFFDNDIQPWRYNWWLPDYGNNDGTVHPLPAGVNPVIHQFSSAGNLDRNVIHDTARWAQLTQTPTPQPAPQEDDVTIIAIGSPGHAYPGTVPTARAVPALGVVLLEGGARLPNDKPSGANHTWRHPDVPDSAKLLGIVDLRPNENYLAALYDFGNNVTHTYRAALPA